MQKKRVLIIDDSAFIRQFLTEILNKSDELVVTAAVSDPTKALQLLKKQEFDVITLDIEMPKMNGLAFLHYLMRFNPKPVVVISSWTSENSNAALNALSLGAIDVVAKPSVGYKEGMQLLEEEILTKVTVASKVIVSRIALGNQIKPALQIVKQSRNITVANKVIAIGASTGGTVAIGKIFKDLKPELPGIIVIQHMPAMFTGAFAETLDQSGPIRVKEAVNGERITKGLALVVPGGKSLKIKKNGDTYIVQIGPRINNTVYNPSIDYTFTSIATEVGANAMGVILTGMGDDGAKGLRAIYDQGANTVAQDEKTSVVFGMPQKAIENGGVQRVVQLEKIAQEINNWGISDN